jgi:hypothetical protein
MIDGDYYPEIQKKIGGYFVHRIDMGMGVVNAQGSGAGMKKYVVGTPDDNGGLSAFQATSNNTYLLRYADVLLVGGEAILGKSAGVQPGQGIDTNAVSTDAVALGYLNKVRQRAVLPALTSFTYKQLLNGRRLEFAIEGDYWYDL